MFEPSWLQGYGGLLLQGFSRTLFIACCSYVFGTVLGLALAWAEGCAGVFGKSCIRFSTLLLRALPELIVIMLLYYACSDLVGWVGMRIGMGLLAVDGTSSAIIVLGVASSAYAAEIFKSGLAAVSRGASDAGASFGMNRRRIFMRISLPLMIPIIFPGLSNLWLMVVKGTSLVSVVGVMELALAAEQGAGATKSYFIFYLTTAGVYLCIAVFSQRAFVLLARQLPWQAADL